MKKVRMLVWIFVFVLVTGIDALAQEIETRNSMLYLRGANNYGVLQIFNHGEMLLNKSSATTSTAFSINVANTRCAFRVKRNWAGVFDVYGSGVVKANGIALESDVNLKDQIIELDSQMDKIKKLKAVSYKWKDKVGKGSKTNYGLLAQDLEMVYPDMVFRGDSGEMGIFYIELIPVLLEAVQEQQAQIEKQAALIDDLDKRLGKLEKKETKK